MAPVMSLCRPSARPGQSLLSSRGSRSSQPRSVAAHATPDERCNAAIATLSAASLLVGAAAPALAADLSVAPSSAAVVTGQTSPSKMVAGVAAPSVLFETADLNADVRDAADSYRDPAIATPQDKVADKLSSGSVSTPDLGVSDAGDKLSSAADDAASKAKDLFSALPANPLAAVADQNADVRDAATGYRDPAGAVQLDAASDALKKAKSQASGSDISDVASDAKDKAKGLLKGKGLSALPGSNPLAAVADQNADVRDAASDYRDPLISTAQDNSPDILEAAKSKTDTSSIGDKVTGAADDAKDKAKGLLKGKGLSALPANPLAAVADQNADVRDAATGYRDPAGAVQLDAASDALKKAKSQASGSDISDVASDAKDKAKGLLKGKGISALPGSNPLAAVADLNRDVHGDAEDYRDPAGAVQQDNAAGAVKDALKSKGKSISTPSLSKVSAPSISTPSLSKVNKQVKKGAEKVTKQVGVTNTVKAGKPVYPISGARLSKPLVQDSVGRSFK